MLAATGRAFQAGLQLDMLDSFAAGREIEIGVADSGVDIVHLGYVTGEFGFDERAPDAIQGARPSVAEAGGTALVQALAIARKSSMKE
jgi:hypothetical protein